MFSKLDWDGLMLKLQTGNEMKPTPPPVQMTLVQLHSKGRDRTDINSDVSF